MTFVSQSKHWIAVVTAWDGPDADHPILVRLTLESNDHTETKVFASASEASHQLEAWLEQKARER